MACGRPVNVVAVMRSTEASAALNEVCAELNDTNVKVYVGHLRDVKAGLEIVEGTDILLFDVDPRAHDEIAHLRNIVAAQFPTIPIVVTVPEATLQDVRKLMRLGVVDVVPQPIGHADLQGALDYAAHVRGGDGQRAESRGRVIAFLKVGGGVGATTLAVQTACMLAARGERDVCLLDFDVQFGAAALYLDLDDRVGLADLLEAPERLDGELLRSVMAHHAGGLDLLAAPRNMAALDVVTPDFVIQCLELARGAYGTVVLDMPAVWTPWSAAAAQSSDLIVLVAQLTVAGVRQAKRQLDALRVHGPGVPLRIALNRVEKIWRRSLALGEAENALGRKVDYVVVNDFRIVNKAINQGVPLSAIKRNSKVEASLRAIAADVAKAVTGEDE